MLFDSHCHLTDERFEGDIAGTLSRARDAGVDGLVTIASDADDAARALALAREHAGVWASAGIHPHAAASADADALRRIEALSAEPGIVALGETGLDYYYDNSPRPEQRRNFEAHLELAARTGLPVVVHARDADDDAAALIAAAAPSVRGVLHCFAAGSGLLETGLERGWYVSFSGLVSFRSWDGAALLRQVPGDRLLIETDSPYLAPVPLRGRRNEPAFVAHVASAVAAVLDEPVEAVAERTRRNARTFYGLAD